MANRAALFRQADATRLFKAAKSAGYERATVRAFPDGRLEVEVEAFRKERPATDSNEWDKELE